MSGYAVRNDGLGMRAVNSAADCLATETYSATQPVLTFLPAPDGIGFAQSIKTALGGIQGVAALPVSIQLIVQWFYAATQAQNWPDVQAIVTANKAALDAVNTAIYLDVKAAATTYHIPITLP
jgi:hypothetical protein